MSGLSQEAIWRLEEFVSEAKRMGVPNAVRYQVATRRELPTVDDFDALLDLARDSRQALV